MGFKFEKLKPKLDTFTVVDIYKEIEISIFIV
jgi:hypothetical protein